MVRTRWLGWWRTPVYLRARSAVTVAAVVFLGCGSPSDPTPAGPPSFEAPVDLGPPVSTAGWEDSGFISPDGATFYFTYLRFDPIRFVEDRTVIVRGPLRPGWDPADTLAAKIYRTSLVNGTWTEPQNLGDDLNIRGALNGGQWLSADGNRILFTDPVGQPARPTPTIYYAERRTGGWTPAVPAPSVGFPFVPGDENPHLTLDESTLFFESSRPGGRGGPDLWMSTKTAAGWSPPVNLGATINTAAIEGSPFSQDGVELFFDDKGSGKGISWTRRQSDNTWRAPVVVIPGVFGDPSLTTAGDLFMIGANFTSPHPDANPFKALRRR